MQPALFVRVCCCIVAASNGVPVANFLSARDVAMGWEVAWRENLQLTHSDQIWIFLKDQR
jgi:hypothetical protein